MQNFGLYDIRNGGHFRSGFHGGSGFVYIYSVAMGSNGISVKKLGLRRDLNTDQFWRTESKARAFTV